MLLPSTVPPGWATVSSVSLYRTVERDGPVTEVPVVTAAGGALSVVWPFVSPGRYWGVLRGETGSGDPLSVDVGSIDLPEDPTLLVSPETLAVKANMPLQLTDEMREVITDEIRAAQSDVSAYLGRPILPTTGVESGLYPWPNGWDLTGLGDEDLIEVVSAVAETGPQGPTGYFTVTYRYGLDARVEACRPIVRYVTAHAMNSPTFTDLWKRVTKTKGEVRTVSAEGQSITWTPATLGGGGGKPGDGSPGSLPTLESLDFWRHAGRRVHQGATHTSRWPFYGRPW